MPSTLQLQLLEELRHAPSALHDPQPADFMGAVPVAVGQLHDQAAVGVFRVLVGSQDLLADFGNVDFLFRQLETLPGPLLRVFFLGGLFALCVEIGVGQQRIDLF